LASSSIGRKGIPHLGKHGGQVYGSAEIGRGQIYHLAKHGGQAFGSAEIGSEADISPG